MRRPSPGPKALALAVGGLTRPSYGKRGFAGAAIVERWPEIVGPAMAACSRPERLTFAHGQKTGGTLHLRVEPGGLATELQHLEPIVIERINGHFGYGAVAALHLIQAPLPKLPPPPPPRAQPTAAERARIAIAVAGIDDAAQRKSLENIGLSILIRNRQAEEAAAAPSEPPPKGQ